MRGTTLAVALLLGSTLMVAPAMAKAKSKHPMVSCAKIQAQIKAGKTQEEVAKDLKVSPSRVRSVWV